MYKLTRIYLLGVIMLDRYSPYIYCLYTHTYTYGITYHYTYIYAYLERYVEGSQIYSRCIYRVHGVSISGHGTVFLYTLYYTCIV